MNLICLSCDFWYLSWSFYFSLPEKMFEIKNILEIKLLLIDIMVCSPYKGEPKCQISSDLKLK